MEPPAPPRSLGGTHGRPYDRGGHPYGDRIKDTADFSARLCASFTYDGKLVCLPKDTSTLEGNWLTGGMKAGYPNVKYTVVPLSAGPAGKGTLAFSQRWGVRRTARTGRWP
ncbi:hypothetical protein ACIBJF_46115 [Streptomyces sp. NPDC050743]|uniref:hypothetical protein n=1 Tax=Streptomyces sp. NPDC050743 TaxID=3365634 RepID=UPI0037976788